MKPLLGGLPLAALGMLAVLSASGTAAAPGAGLSIDYGDKPNRNDAPGFVVSTGKSPAIISSIVIRRVEVTRGDMAFEVANSWSLSAATPGCKDRSTSLESSSHCSFTMKPNDALPGWLALPEPGSHRIRMALVDGDGETHNFDLVADRHWGWGWLLLALVTGTGGGILVGRWRDGGRAQVQQLLAVNSARAQLRAALAGTSYGANQLLGLADELAQQIADGQTDLQVQVAELQRRTGIATRLIAAPGGRAAVIRGMLEWLGNRPEGLATAVSTADIDTELQRLAAPAATPQALPAMALETGLPITAAQMEPDTPPADLRRRLRWQDGKVQFILLSLFVLVAFVAQWGATWGGIGDVVTAVVTGFGAWATLNQGVDVLVSTARRRT